MEALGNMLSLSRNIRLSIPDGKLVAHLQCPESARTLVLMARAESRAEFDDSVATGLLSRNHAVLTIDLLIPGEAHFNHSEGNAPLLAQRLIKWLDFIRTDGDMEQLILGLYATGHAAPAAIRAAAQRDAAIRAVVVSGGLIDHAGLEYLQALVAPLLILSDGSDPLAEIAAQRAVQHISAPFEVPSIAPEAIAQKTVAWFERWLPVKS